MITTRFAPSPTGPLHLGHAYSAIVGHDLARAAGGRFLLRIDDLDQSRARQDYVDLLIEDLTWLGLSWDAVPRVQSQCAGDYRGALEKLVAMDLVFPCRCSRADIAAAASAPQEGEPVIGPDGMVYPGTCRSRSMADAGPDDALRLDIDQAIRALPSLPTFEEVGPERPGHHTLSAATLLTEVGDVVLQRRTMDAAYHLAVVVDDDATGITHVVRGTDLFEATWIHVLLQALLSLPQPIYHHHRLIRDDAGKRLAKRDDARAIRRYRDDGASPEDIRRMIGL